MIPMIWQMCSSRPNQINISRTYNFTEDPECHLYGTLKVTTTSVVRKQTENQNNLEIRSVSLQVIRFCQDYAQL